MVVLFVLKSAYEVIEDRFDVSGPLEYSIPQFRDAARAKRRKKSIANRSNPYIYVVRSNFRSVSNHFDRFQGDRPLHRSKKACSIVQPQEKNETKNPTNGTSVPSPSSFLIKHLQVVDSEVKKSSMSRKRRLWGFNWQSIC